MQKTYKIISSEAEYLEALEHINESEFLAFDTETTGLNVRKDKVIGFAFSGKSGVGYYYPTYKWENGELVDCRPDHTTEVDLLDALQESKLIMHNASYDCRIVESNYGVSLVDSLHCDTILLKHAVDEERPFGLKDIAKKIQKEIDLDIEKAANEEQEIMLASIKANGGSTTKENYELYKAEMEKIGIYACADVDLTIRVFNYYSKKLAEERLDKFFYEDETMPLLKNVTIPMESRGIPVNFEELKAAKIEIVEDIKALEDKIQKQIKPLLEEFESWYLNLKFPPRRSGAFAQALISLSNLPLPKTKSGRFSLSESSLKALAPSSSEDRAIVEYLLGGPYLDDALVEKVQKSMWEETGERHMLNLSSKHHLKKLFFEKLGEKPVNTTDKGNPQVDNYFLTIIKEKYDWVQDLIDYNKLCKIEGSYIDRFLEQAEDGIFYPRFFQHRTISGRYGSDIQQLPRPLEPGQASDLVVKHTNKIRRFFISGEGWRFIDADYESLEPHVFAHVSRDEGLKDIFRKGNDFYSTIAIDTEKLEGVSADKSAKNYLGEVNKPLRQKAKAYALGIPYGLESFKLSKTLGIGQKAAERLINKYLEAYPELAKWMERSEHECVTKGRIRSEAGRVRHMPKAPKIWYGHSAYILDSLELWKRFNENPKKYASMKHLRREMKNYLNNAKNFQIQSLAASITNRACIAIARELKRQGSDGYIAAQIHDQIVVRVPEAEAEKWQRTVQYIMENAYKISLSLKAPAEIAEDFNEGH